jgi:hypothetical protein
MSDDSASDAVPVISFEELLEQEKLVPDDLLFHVSPERWGTTPPLPATTDEAFLKQWEKIAADRQSIGTVIRYVPKCGDYKDIPRLLVIIDYGLKMSKARPPVIDVGYRTRIVKKDPDLKATSDTIAHRVLVEESDRYTILLRAAEHDLAPIEVTPEPLLPEMVTPAPATGVGTDKVVQLLSTIDGRLVQMLSLMEQYQAMQDCVATSFVGFMKALAPLPGVIEGLRPDAGASEKLTEIIKQGKDLARELHLMDQRIRHPDFASGKNVAASSRGAVYETEDATS